MPIRRLVPALICLLFVLHGCGGGGKTNVAPPTSAAVRFSIDWAARSRGVAGPSSALSAVLTLTGAGTSGTDFTFSVNRDAAPAAYTGSYTSTSQAKIGTWPMALRFYAQADGGGAVVGIAQTTANVTASGTSLGTITTTGTIASVAVPAGQIVLVGATQDLVFTAKDASGSIVAVSSGSAFFTSSVPNILQIADGQAKGVAVGVSNITATVDGKASAPVEVFVRKANAMEYIVTDIGTLGGSGTVGGGVNNLGEVVGTSVLVNGKFAPFLWQNGAIGALPTLPNGSGPDGAHDINDAGKIVGNAGPELGGGYQLVTWQNSAIESISQTGGLNGLHSAHLNQTGQVVFFGTNRPSGSPPLGVHIWTAGTLTTIWSTGADEFAINDNGDVAFGGYSLSQTGQAQLHATLWHQGTTTQLPDDGYSTANGINNSAQVVGSSQFGGQASLTVATLWQNGTRTQLPTIVGFDFGLAIAINETGETVGKCFTSDIDGGTTSSAPVIWRDGAVFDLRTMVPAGSLPDGRGEAVAINDVGQILVVVRSSTVPSPLTSRTFLLTPK